MTETETPTIAQLTADLHHLHAGVRAMQQSWENRFPDGSQWPLLLAELHSIATDLTNKTQDIAADLQAYAAVHPDGELPEDPSHVTVIGHSAGLLAQMLADTGDDLELMKTALLDEHHQRLPGPRPHTVQVTYTFDPVAPTTAIADFHDATGRLVVSIYYGHDPDDARQDIAERGLHPVPGTYVPRTGGIFFSLNGTQAMRMYDRFGTHVDADLAKDEVAGGNLVGDASTPTSDMS